MLDSKESVELSPGGAALSSEPPSQALSEMGGLPLGYEPGGALWAPYAREMAREGAMSRAVEAAQLLAKRTGEGIEAANALAEAANKTPTDTDD